MNRLTKLPIVLLCVVFALFVVGCGAGEQGAPADPTQSDDQQTTNPVPPTSSSLPTPVATFVATATPRPTNTPSAAQETTALGGRLRIATIPPIQQLVGTWLGTTTSANMQVRPFTDPLLHTDRFDGSLVPGLATSWEANDDGTQWTFHLRDDVEFNRGWGPFTAHDVPHSVILNTREDAIATDTGLFRELFGQTQEGAAGQHPRPG